MKKLLLSFFSLFFTLAVQAQYTSIPDQNFEKKLVELGHDDVLDGRVQTAKIDTVKSLNLYGQSINNLNGVEAFKSLEFLYVSYNRIDSLDLSKNIALTFLSCSRNRLKHLKLGNKKVLKELRCERNFIRELDLSECPSLNFINCEENQLINLNISGNKSLEFVYCDDNLLEMIDLSGCISLTKLDCSNNSLTKLNILGCVSLNALEGEKNKLTELNLSSNLVLEDLSIYDNKLKTLNLSANSKLRYLNCFRNTLEKLNLIGASSLEIVNCFTNSLTNLDISSNIFLTELNCSSNKLETLDPSKNSLLNNLRCGNNKIKNLNVTNNIKLSNLGCSNNQLTQLDLSKSKILLLYCENNLLNCVQVANEKIAKSANNNERIEFAKEEWKEDDEVFYSVDCGFSEKFNISLTSGTGGEISTLSNQINKWEHLELTISPDEGYQISELWLNGEKVFVRGSYKKFNYSNVKKDLNFEANFEEIFYSVYLKTSDGGSLKAFNSKVKYGNPLMIECVSEEGYELSELKINNNVVSTSDAKYYYNELYENIYATAKFKKIIFSVNSNKTIGGEIITKSDSTEYGENVVLTITPEEGYFLKNLSINGITVTPYGSTYTVHEVTENITAVATFEKGNVFSGGDGTEGNPYQISKLEQLNYISSHATLWDKHFILIMDIDASETKNWNFGKGFKPIARGYSVEDPKHDKNLSFKGSFNGNNKAIDNLKINRPLEDNIGLFHTLSYEAKINNLSLMETEIVGKRNVGTLAGINMGHVFKCYATGNVKGSTVIGGLFGTERGDCEYSFSNVNVKGEGSVGGFAGFIYGSRVSQCYSIGNVEAEGDVGGFAGFGKGFLSGAYWDMNSSMQALGQPEGHSLETTGLTTAEFSDKTIFRGWDFGKVWIMETRIEIDSFPRPYLRNERTDLLTIIPSDIKQGKVHRVASYGESDTITLKAEAYTAYKFSHWEVVTEPNQTFENIQNARQLLLGSQESTIYSDENPLVLTNLTKLTLEAIFEKIEQPIYYEVFTNISLHGSISLAKDSIESGESISFTVTANDGYQIQDVLINSKSIGSVESYTLSDIQEDKSIEAIFEKIEQPIYYQLTTNISLHGSISLPKDSIEAGESISFTATANDGYQIQDVLINSKSIGSVESYTLSDIQEDKSIEAIFEKIEQPIYYQLITNISLHGSISLAKDSIESGESISFSVTANYGYQIQDVLINSKSIGAVGSYTLSDIQEDKSIEAIFEKIEQPIYYQLTTNISLHGSISLPKDSIEAGESISFTATANDGYQIQDVLVNGKSVGVVEKYTLSDIQEDKMIEAVFVKKAIVLGASDLENISIHPNPVKNKLTISGLHAGEKIQIIDLQGNVLFGEIAKTASIEFDLTSLKTGVYFVSVEERIVQKILKK